MSGAETIAGLVLGGFPILVSAIERYRQCFDVLDCWWQFKSKYQACKYEIEYLQWMYEDALELLLLPLGKTEKELEELKSDTSHEAWASIETNLRGRLRPRAFTIYRHVMEELHDEMEAFKNELAYQRPLFQKRLHNSISEANAAPVNDKKTAWRDTQSQFSYEAQRLKFSVGEDTRKKSFGRIKELIERLQKLLSNSDAISEARRVHSTGSATTSAALLVDSGHWRHAHNIYMLLLRSWRCGCVTDHCADLLLQHPQGAEMHLEMTFRFTQASLVGRLVPWRWHFAHIRLIDPPDPCPPKRPKMQAQSTVKAGIQITKTPKGKGLLQSALKKTRRKCCPQKDKDLILDQLNGDRSKVVMFADDATTLTLQSTRIQHYPADKVAIPSKTTDPVAGPELATIDGLCTALTTCGLKQCLGRLTGPESEHEYLVSSMIKCQIPGDTRTVITLTNLLSMTPVSRPDRSKRCRIALAIAYSQLQLHSSAWLTTKWTRDDIVFVLESDAPRLDQPCLRKPFSALEPTSGTLRADYTFATLGILLLELCFGLTLDESPYRKEFLSPRGEPDLSQDIAAAWKWAEHVEGDAGPEYATAVDWCLAKRSVRLDDKAWRLEFHEIVIGGLRQCCTSLGVVA